MLFDDVVEDQDLKDDTSKKMEMDEELEDVYKDE